MQQGRGGSLSIRIKMTMTIVNAAERSVVIPAITEERAKDDDEDWDWECSR